MCALALTACTEGRLSDATPATDATPDTPDDGTHDASVDVPGEVFDGAPRDGTEPRDVAPDVTTVDALDASRDGMVADVARDVSAPDAAPRCRTRVTYGSAWMHPPDHPEAWDEVDGVITWDGVCTDDGANSYAVLSNGWRPYFAGHGRCDVSLDARDCAGVAGGCATRFTYGDAWMHPSDHPAQWDDVADVGAWDGVCHREGASSYAVLSNGWRPHFGGGGCAVSIRRTQCGARYVNPVIGGDCPDPGVLREGADYYLVCTSGNAADAFPLRRSRDLVHWERLGVIFPAGSRPSWASGDFWAPEMHRVGARFVVYFTARRAGGQLAIGAAVGDGPTGPFRDLGRPLLYDASMGLIDATMYTHSDGARYLYWKEDGNAVGRATPIHSQRLADDGLSVVGAAPTVITNDLPWEGELIEAPWVVAQEGAVFLFYSANAFYDGRYALGVARASSPLGPFTKHGAPILVTGNGFVGPGHGSVVTAPSGGSALVYHAWREGFVNTFGEGREVLVDGVQWSGGWPALSGAPSNAPRAYP